MDKKHLKHLPVLVGSEISILAQIAKQKDVGFIPFVIAKL